MNGVRIKRGLPCRVARFPLYFSTDRSLICASKVIAGDLSINLHSRANRDHLVVVIHLCEGLLTNTCSRLLPKVVSLMYVYRLDEVSPPAPKPRCVWIMGEGLAGVVLLSIFLFPVGRMHAIIYYTF